VSGLTRDASGLQWTETENALPLYFNRGNATQALLLRLTKIESELNQEPLRVTGLDEGQYKLAIDGQTIGNFAAAELSKGINLAEYGTPMRHQSDEVSWLVRDRDESRYVHLRMAIRKFGAAGASGQDEMSAFENSLEDAIYEQALPKAHAYRLSSITTAP
jgi:hypothetical protein